MPTTPSTNGLTTFSMHTRDESSTLDGLRGGHASLWAEEGPGPDPETAARHFLDQALDSDAVPALTAPTAGETVSRFALIDTETVPLTGTRVVKFRQTLHDIPVYGSLVSVELDADNSLLSIDSSLGEPTDVDPVATVSPAGSREAVAQDPQGYRPRLEGIVPRLSYYFDRAADRWRLAYILQDVGVSKAGRAKRSDPEPPHIVDYVVDAHDGRVVAVLPRTPSAAPTPNQQETAPDELGEQRSFTVSSQGGKLVLFDPEHNVKTFDFAFGDPEVHDARLPGALVANPPAWSKAAVSAHTQAVAVSEYLRTTLKRNNIDNRGGLMASSVNCVVQRASHKPNEWINAFWNGRQMVYGQVQRTSGLRSLSANLDVVGHEMFHGVTDRTARLEYRIQSGAMNESYSDIFGTVISNDGQDDPRTWDWQVGERLLPNDKPLRDMADPTRFGQPAHMRDFVVKPDTEQGDWGGVHTNSGIHNKAAYLIFTSVASGDLVFTPVGAAAVFYLALTQRLTRTSQFLDGRRAVLASAQTYFRNDPAPLLKKRIDTLRAAFDAVGIVDPV